MCAQIAWKITWGKQRETEIVWFNYSWMARNESSFETILKYTRKWPTCLIMRKSRTERIVSASYPLSHNQCKGSVGSQIEHQIHQLWGPLKFDVLIFLKKVERIISKKNTNSHCWERLESIFNKMSVIPRRYYCWYLYSAAHPSAMIIMAKNNSTRHSFSISFPVASWSTAYVAIHTRLQVQNLSAPYPSLWEYPHWTLKGNY